MKIIISFHRKKICISKCKKKINFFHKEIIPVTVSIDLPQEIIHKNTCHRKKSLSIRMNLLRNILLQEEYIWHKIQQDKHSWYNKLPVTAAVAWQIFVTGRNSLDRNKNTIWGKKTLSKRQNSWHKNKISVTGTQFYWSMPTNPVEI